MSLPSTASAFVLPWLAPVASENTLHGTSDLTLYNVRSGIAAA
jgi:hypothetical protein